MGNAPPISAQQLKQLRTKYDKDGNGDLSWEEFKALALEVGQLQGLKTPVSEEKLQKIFQGLDADSSGSVNFQEFEAAHAKLQEQLQAAAKAKAKAKPKAKAEGKAKAKPKPKAKAPAADAVAENQASIFDSLPGFDSFIPTIGVPDLGVSSLFAEDSRVPVAKAIPTPKKTKPPPLPEPPPAPLNSQAPWSAQLKAADPDWYDPDDAEFSGSDDFPDVGEVPEEPLAPPAAPAAPAAPQAPPKAEPKPEAKAKPKAKGEAKAKPKADAKAKAKVKPKAKPQVNQLGQLKEPKGRAEGVSPLEGVTEDVFSSPIHRREAVAHPPDKRDPRVVRAMQMPSGMEMIEQEQEVLSEPESQDSVDSISGEVTRSWDPTAKDVRYTYARDRAVGFSEFWRPLKWSEEEWERRLLASGNLRKRGGLGIARHEKPPEPKPKPKAVPKEPEPEVEQLIAPEKPKKPRSQYPLATEVKPKFIDVPLSGLQGAAAEGAVQSMRKTAKKPVSPVLEDPDDELLNSRPAPREPVRAGEPLVPLGTVKPFSNERQTAPSFGHPTQPESFQMPSPVYTGGASPRTMLRPIMQEVQAPKRVPEEHDVGEYGDKPGRTWL